MLGLSPFILGQYGPAVAALEPIRDHEQDDLDYFCMLGIAYGQLKRSDQSRQAFAQLVRAGGDKPQLHLLLGKAYLDLYDNPKAQEELQKAIAGDPKLPFAHYDLGVLYRRLGQRDKAQEEFDKEMTINPTEPWAFEVRAELRLEQGDVDRAPLFHRALALNPRFAAALAGLGRASLHRGQTEEAISYLKRAVALEPDSAKFHYQLGQAYLKKGEHAEAKKEFAEQQRPQARAVEKDSDRIFGRLPLPAEPAP